jgi:hypothetical protein
VLISKISYKNYWANDPKTEVVPANLNYFHETYQDCRKAFISSAMEVSEKYDSVHIGKFMVESKVDKDLSVDWCYIPASVHNDKLLIINSGLHGIEGYTGSAIQLMVMDKILNAKQLENMGILFIHGLNPYGFKYHRKVTENNVDLNRNCVTPSDRHKSKNEGYEKLTDLLMPEGNVNSVSMRNQYFYLLAIYKIIRESMPVLRQAALQGQYDFDKGIYYGGQEYEPQIALLKPFLKEKMDEYNMVLNVDLHTAYGERGKMHLFLNPIDDVSVKNGIETLFKNVQIDWGGGKDFYTIKGEYLGWANSLADKKTFCMPMLFEFGTLNSQTTFGSLKSIQVMINENQGAHYGFKNTKSEVEVKKHFDEMYYPSSPVWRSKAISDSYNRINEMIKNYEIFVLKN